jgi:hypothetical protein
MMVAVWSVQRRILSKPFTHECVRPTTFAGDLRVEADLLREVSAALTKPGAAAMTADAARVIHNPEPATNTTDPSPAHAHRR